MKYHPYAAAALLRRDVTDKTFYSRRLCSFELYCILGGFKLGGRHLVDIIGDISWTLLVTFCGHFCPREVLFWVTFHGHFWVTFRGHFLGEFLWPFIKQLTNPNLT